MAHEEEVQQPEDQEHRQDTRDQLPHVGVLGRDAEGNIVCHQEIAQPFVDLGDVHLKGRRFLNFGVCGRFQLAADVLHAGGFANDLAALDATARYVGRKVRVEGDFLVLLLLALIKVPHQQ